LENLKVVIEFREEGIHLIRKVLEKSESKVENQKDVNSIIESIMTDFSNANKSYSTNKILLLKNTLEIVLEKQIENSRLANKIRKQKISLETWGFLSNLD
jgi:hypothetical protein